MKIVIPSSTLSYVIGGAEKIVLRQAEYLARHGHHIYILTLKSPRKTKSFMYHNFRQKKLKSLEVIEFDIPSKYKWLYQQVESPDRHYWDTEALYFNELTYSTIEEISPDIIFSHYLLYGLFKPKDIPNVLYLVGYATDVQEIRDVFFRFYDALIAISSNVKNKWERCLDSSTPCYVLNTGVDLNGPQANKKAKTDKKFNLVFLGRVIERKGVKTLIEALKTVISREKNLRLWIVGDGAYRSKAEALVKELGLTGFVTFVGFCEKPQVYLQLADICIFPSYAKEGLMGVVLEAMAEGAPIISTTDNGNEDVIDPDVTGVLVEPRDSEVLSDAILRLLENEDFRRKMGYNAKRFAKQNLSWDCHIKGLMKIFESTIMSKGTINKGLVKESRC